MNKAETLKVLSILFVAYPKTYKDLTDNDKIATATLWEIQFKNESYIVVNKALNNLIATKVYPPVIADLKAEIDAVKNKAQRLYERHIRATIGDVISYIDVITDKLVRKTITEGEPLSDEELKEVCDILGKSDVPMLNVSRETNLEI